MMHRYGRRVLGLLHHTLAQRDLEEKDMRGMSPLDDTPPSADRRWIQYPGYNGASVWGGISIDRQRGIVADDNDMPNHNRLIPRREADARGLRPLTDAERPDDTSPDFAPQAGGEATPVTYEIGGRQFVVIMAGGRRFAETKIGDYVVTFALSTRND